MKILGYEPQPLTADGEKTMANWIMLSGYIYQADITAQELIDMIHYELQGKRRLQIIERLHARFNKIRLQEEKDEILWLLSQSQKKTQSDTSKNESSPTEA